MCYFRATENVPYVTAGVFKACQNRLRLAVQKRSVQGLVLAVSDLFMHHKAGRGERVDFL